MTVVEDRFWSHVERADGCWEWQGYIDPTGYGKVYADRTTRWAHRVAWELTFGPIGTGLYVCHRCDNRRCVRPDHLFVGTQRDNMVDAVAKGRTARGDRSGPRLRDYGATCKRGHDRTTYTGHYNGGRRYCKRCHADRMAAVNAARRSA